MVVANATGCSSIYGGNLPTTPWTVDADGRGPAWNNSLFEDAAEFGLGMRLAYEAQARSAATLLERLAPRSGTSSPASLAPQRGAAHGEPRSREQRERVARLRLALGRPGRRRRRTATCGRSPAQLVRQSVWIIGGDGWAYDIGFGGLDHVLSTGENVNILVLDTEVYSNTGGQASKATSRGAVAKFAARGKGAAKKDLGAIARAYGNVYVAQVAMGANDAQATKALLEAEAWPGPSLVIAYSTCIAHGIDMSKSMTHQKDAVEERLLAALPLPSDEADEGQPFKLDSKPPSIPLRDFVATEARFAILMRSDPERADGCWRWRQADIDERWRYYEQLARIEPTIPHVRTRCRARGRERRAATATTRRA